MKHRGLRVVARFAEALGLSLLGGVAVAGIGLVVGWLPLVPPAFLGLLAGGATTMRTLGAQIASRRLRMALAGLGALLGLSVATVIDYASFVRDQRAHHLAADYRLPAAEVDLRIRRDLQALTGRTGIVGYRLATIELGAAVGPWRIAGVPLAVLQLLDCAVAVVVAVRWAAGPPVERDAA